MKYDKILIDISNFYHRGYHVAKDITTTLGDGEEIITGGILKTLQMLQRVERDFLAAQGEVYFLFDNPFSGDGRRREIDPDYKSTRTEKEVSFKRSLDFLHLILLSYKDIYKVVKVEGYEADDLVQPLVEMFPEDNILLISNDMDWFRSISKKVKVAKYEAGDYIIYDKEKFEEVFGFEPTVDKICLYKSFRGDKGDNIPVGVERIREEVLVQLVKEFNSVSEIIKHINYLDYVTPLFKQRIKESLSRLLINYKLVSFFEISKEALEEGIYQCKFSPHVLNSLYKSLKFDIKIVDPRVFQFFPTQEEPGFFKLKKIPRA